ncbi:MAG: hypothetical protein ACC614_09590 [Methanobacterium formicicum]|uniref:hypothetical protein n=1 Tax=Methanobacterium formicicum TaxID=2162 RepID=UPI0035310890
MIVGLDRSFQPKWVYKMLQLAEPGLEFKKVEPQFLDLVEYSGSKSKINVLTVIRRYYIQIVKKDGKEYFGDNYLHNLSLNYSYNSLKPVLLFVLINECPIAQFLQSKINLLFIDQEFVESKVLHKHAKKIYGDRKVVTYAVGYYLTILSYFDILEKHKNSYSWKKRQLMVPDHILKEMLILYSHINDRYEIDVLRISDDVAFSLFDLSNLENVLMEYNGKEWAYQKRVDTKKVIITNKYKRT